MAFESKIEEKIGGNWAGAARSGVVSFKLTSKAQTLLPRREMEEVRVKWFGGIL
jgi:hypothetical protein